VVVGPSVLRFADLVTQVCHHHVPNPAPPSKPLLPHRTKPSNKQLNNSLSLSPVTTGCLVNTRYDLNGNRNMTGWSTGGNNRLTGDGTFTYVYDNEGNLLSKTRLSDSQLWTFTWDYRNRLTQAVVKTSGGVTVANDLFTYDIEDRRIGKSTNGTQTWTFYNGQNPYADFNGAGSLTYRYLYGKGLDQLFARYDGTASKWYLTDNIGSIRLFVTTAGTILDQLSYDGYGNILTETNSANGDRFKYTARDWDSEIGLQYNRARYYNPQAGRWISMDPVGFAAGDSDLYRYAGNNPIRNADPSGLTVKCKSFSGGFIFVMGGTLTVYKCSDECGNNGWVLGATAQGGIGIGFAGGTLVSTGCLKDWVKVSTVSVNVGLGVVNVGRHKPFGPLAEVAGDSIEGGGVLNLDVLPGPNLGVTVGAGSSTLLTGDLSHPCPCPTKVGGRTHAITTDQATSRV
jgi:RHS repeat-associated protein